MKKTWTERVAGIVVHTLVAAKLLKDEDVERAMAIVEEEIRVRLVIGDWPDDSYKSN